MKGSMKKLAVMVIIVAIAMFLVGAMASADDHTGKKAIRGQFAATAAGTCILSQYGFNDDLTPAVTPKCPQPPQGTQCIGIGSIQAFSREGVFTFEHDGTGSATSTVRVVQQVFLSSGSTLPPPNPPTIYVAGSFPGAGSANVEFDFTYTVEDGMVTITQKPGTYFSEWTSGPAAGKIYKSEGWKYTGSITPDGKEMNLWTERDSVSGAPVILTLQQVSPTVGPVMEMICNFDTVLIWQHE